MLQCLQMREMLLWADWRTRLALLQGLGVWQALLPLYPLRMSQSLLLLSLNLGQALLPLQSL